MGIASLWAKSLSDTFSRASEFKLEVAENLSSVVVFWMHGWVMMGWVQALAWVCIPLGDGKGRLIRLSSIQKQFSDPSTVMLFATGSWAKLTASFRRLLLLAVWIRDMAYVNQVLVIVADP